MIHLPNVTIFSCKTHPLVQIIYLLNSLLNTLSPQQGKKISRRMQRTSNKSVGATAATGVHSHPACAACKHQRKKCDENCVLAPYFPVERTREFQAVHKVFGVSNATKIVRNASNEEDRKKVADSLVWEAFCRHKDPVQGPYGEYRKIYEELNLYKTQTINQTMLLHLQSGQEHNHQDETAVFKMIPSAVTNQWSYNYNNNHNHNNNNKRLDMKGASINNNNNVSNNVLFGDYNNLVDFSGFGDKSIDNAAATGVVPLQYYAADVGHINGKTLESTRWDNIL